MLGAFFQIKALQASFLPIFSPNLPKFVLTSLAQKELNKNTTSKKCYFCKIKAHTAILRRYSHILPIFPHRFCLDFHQIKSFGRALATPPPTPMLKNVISYMDLTEIQLKIYRFHGSLSQKGSRPLMYIIMYIRTALLYMYIEVLPWFHCTQTHPRPKC